MKITELFNNKYRVKLVWFLAVFLSSLVPIIYRLILHLENTNKHFLLFDVKDLLYAALGVTISNFSLVQGRQIFDISIIVWISVAFIMILGFVIGVFLKDESLPQLVETTLAIKCFGAFFSSVAFLFSYSANTYILERKIS